MENIIYKTTIKDIGSLASEALTDNFLITFQEGAPSDLADYCFIIEKADLPKSIAAGQTLQLGNHQYPIVTLGDVVNTNLKELGHVTIKFINSDVNDLQAGSIYVTGNAPEHLAIGDQFVIYEK